MADGRGSELAGRIEYDPPQASVTLSLGGSLVEAKTGISGGLGGGPRGLVTGFSSAARRRLMRFIASLERDVRPIFVTLTYPDVFDDSHAKWKRDIDVFGKRLKRQFEGAGFVWRIEFKERQTGKGAGRVAPHYHLLVYGAPYRRLLAWIKDNWWEVVGSNDADHYLAGTAVEKIYSYGGVMRYVGKYIAKEDSYPDDWQGKAWGVVGRSRLPFAVKVVISLTEQEAIKLIRLGRKMIKAKGRSFTFGLTWIVNAERVLDYLEWCMGFT